MNFILLLWLKKFFVLVRKAMTKLDSILKSRDVILLTKIQVSPIYGFSSSHVEMWEFDHKKGWVTNNLCFLTVVLERFLRVPWTAWRSNQSVLKEIKPEYSLDGPVGKVMSLLFNILSRFVIAFLPRSKCLLILWLQSPSAVILEPKKIKSVTVSIVSPSICHGSDGTGCHCLHFLNLEF